MDHLFYEAQYQKQHLHIQLEVSNVHKSHLPICLPFSRFFLTHIWRMTGFMDVTELFMEE